VDFAGVWAAGLAGGRGVGIPSSPGTGVATAL
jgi:hypothetical protein